MQFKRNGISVIFLNKLLLAQHKKRPKGFRFRLFVVHTGHCDRQ